MRSNKEENAILINEDLFSESIDEYANKNLEYINIPDSVGIATEYKDNKKTYIVYLNNESGYNIYNKNANSFIKAVIFAREIYEGLISYFKGIEFDIVKIIKSK